MSTSADVDAARNKVLRLENAHISTMADESLCRPRWVSVFTRAILPGAQSALRSMLRVSFAPNALCALPRPQLSDARSVLMLAACISVFGARPTLSTCNGLLFCTWEHHAHDHRLGELRAGRIQRVAGGDSRFCVEETA